jgi:hypothetical protein
MNELLYSPKIKPEHLARKAIVYLRQSSERQVRQNLESQRLQYEMAERIRGLGWQQIEIIDSDLGASAAIGSIYREGFERVLSSVALGEVGILVSREVSRLSRTDKDWCRLVEVYQIFGTLIGDEQQVYDLTSSEESVGEGERQGWLSPRNLRSFLQVESARQNATFIFGRERRETGENVGHVKFCCNSAGGRRHEAQQTGGPVRDAARGISAVFQPE